MVYKLYILPIGWYTTYQLVRERETAIDVFPIHLEKIQGPSMPTRRRGHYWMRGLWQPLQPSPPPSFRRWGFTSLDHLFTQIAINSINLNSGHLREDFLAKYYQLTIFGVNFFHMTWRNSPTEILRFGDRYGCGCLVVSLVGAIGFRTDGSVGNTRPRPEIGEKHIYY